MAPELAVGMAVRVPATMFGDAWARSEHGKGYRNVFYDGKVESFAPKGTETGKGPSKHDLWKLTFPDDDKLYPQKWDGLIKWLSPEDLRALTRDSATDKQVTLHILILCSRFLELGASGENLGFACSFACE